ncbi:MAG: hypothetical protein JWM68_43 [Verrucomicrobiales bacterium]|nr:hypothetical protein [Verrucomicrobiales bacterium]
MTTTRKILVLLALAALSAAIYEAYVASTLRARISKLQELQTDHIQQLTNERDGALISASEKKEELERLRKDQSELLRLRGEIGMLRHKTNELGKLLELNRRTQPALLPEAQAPQQAQANLISARETGSTAWMQAFLAYAKMNGGQLPASFEQAEPFWPKELEKSNDNPADQFEIIYHGSLNSLTNDDVLVFREKKLWQNPVNGRWGRLSVMASGRAQYGSVPPGTPDGNFSEWEKEHLAPASAR